MMYKINKLIDGSDELFTMILELYVKNVSTLYPDYLWSGLSTHDVITYYKLHTIDDNRLIYKYSIYSSRFRQVLRIPLKYLNRRQ